MTNIELAKRLRNTQEHLINTVMTELRLKASPEILNNIDDAIRDIDIVAPELEILN